MNIQNRKTVSISEADQNFSEITGMADELGSVVICKNGKPKYRLTDIEQENIIEMTDDEKIDFVAARILKLYRKAFEELAKS